MTVIALGLVTCAAWCCRHDSSLSILNWSTRLRVKWGYTVDKNIGCGYARRAEGASDEWLQSGRYELEVASESSLCCISRHYTIPRPNEFVVRFFAGSPL